VYSAFLILSNHASDCFNGLLPQETDIPNNKLTGMKPFTITRSEDKTTHKLYGIVVEMKANCVLFTG